MITSKFSYSLSEKEKSDINTLYDSFKYISIDQNIEWAEITVFKKKCYFTLFNENKLIGYCIIYEKIKYAYVSFGPIYVNKSIIPLMIEAIFNHYKKLNFGQVVIQPGWTSLDNSIIFNRISKKGKRYKIRTKAF